MSRKNFSSGIDAILGGMDIVEEKSPIKKTQTPQKPSSHSTDDEITPILSKTTVYLNEETLEKIKALAFWERSHIKDVIQVALDNFLLTKDANVLENAIKDFNSKKKGNSQK